MMRIHYKILGEALLFIPILLLLMFGIGEMSSGITGSLQHIIQLIPMVILAIISWQYPRSGGFILIAAALILAIIYFLFFHTLPLSTRLLTDFVLFGIPALAGISFIFSDKSKK